MKEFIESGVLELYVLGQASESEMLEVEEMSKAHIEVREEIDQIERALETLAVDNAIAPDPTVKPFLMATLRFISRMEKGETPGSPLELTHQSKVSDYNEWLNRADLQLEEPLNGVYAHIIGNTPQAITAIVWIKDLAPTESHDDEFERFLILEGTCDIVVEDKIYHMTPGDFMEIPLHKNHHVKITSECACKVILQRVAA